MLGCRLEATDQVRYQPLAGSGHDTDGHALHPVIVRFLLDEAGLEADEAASGTVMRIQRFGESANLNIHLHCLVPHGACQRGTDGAPVFIDGPASTVTGHGHARRSNAP